jgi:hypothetical protein
LIGLEQSDNDIPVQTFVTKDSFFALSSNGRCTGHANKVGRMNGSAPGEEWPFTFSGLILAH